MRLRPAVAVTLGVLLSALAGAQDPAPPPAPAGVAAVASPAPATDAAAVASPAAPAPAAVAPPSSATPAAPASPSSPSASPAREAIAFALAYERLPLRFRETPLADVVRALQDATWLNVVLDPAVDDDQPVTFVADGAPLGPALERLLEPLGLSSRVWCDVLYVAPRDQVLAEPPAETCPGALRAYTVHHSQAPVQAVLDELALLSRLTFTLSPRAAERTARTTVSLRVRNLPLHLLLHLLCHHTQLAWSRRGQAVWVHLPEETAPPG